MLGYPRELDPVDCRWTGLLKSAWTKVCFDARRGGDLTVVGGNESNTG